jgi:hypothetical protein
VLLKLKINHKQTKAAMSGFLAFLMFFGCLLICAQMGCITAQPDERGRIVLFAGGPGAARQIAARIIRNNLLTVDQVMGLDEQEFKLRSSQDDGDDVVGGGGEGEEACTCAICLDEFEDMEKVRILPCGHRFHEACLLPWLTERHSSCPLCKFDVMQYILDKEGNAGVNGESKERGVPPPPPTANPAGIMTSNLAIVDNFHNENPGDIVSAPVSLWNHLWGFRGGWSVNPQQQHQEGHQHLFLENASSEDDEENQSDSDTRNSYNNRHHISQGSTIAEIEMESRSPVSSLNTPTGTSASIVEDRTEVQPQ